MRLEPGASAPKILIVEDDALVRMSGVNFLEHAGFEVMDAEGADAAIAILEGASEVRLVFSDIDMPGSMDGLELAKLVHERWPTIRLLLTSGHWNFTEVTIPREGRFVSKPYDTSTIVNEIVALLG